MATVTYTFEKGPFNYPFRSEQSIIDGWQYLAFAISPFDIITIQNIIIDRTDNVSGFKIRSENNDIEFDFDYFWYGMRYKFCNNEKEACGWIYKNLKKNGDRIEDRDWERFYSRYEEKFIEELI
jgi:hypothetical protein